MESGSRLGARTAFLAPSLIRLQDPGHPSAKVRQGLLTYLWTLDSIKIATNQHSKYQETLSSNKAKLLQISWNFVHYQGSTYVGLRIMGFRNAFFKQIMGSAWKSGYPPVKLPPNTKDSLQGILVISPISAKLTVIEAIFPSSTTFIKHQVYFFLPSIRT